MNLLHELMELEVSANVDAVFPSPGNVSSPYKSTMSGRIVIDIWDAPFSFIQQGLSDLGDYGITDCVGIIHNWQNQGYDNALPETYSANPDLGGSAGIEGAITQGKADGCLMGVHENYVDYYPNYPSFNPSAVALNSDGSPMLSWLNVATGIQSFSTKPNWMVANAETQSPVIHGSYGTTAGYIDVSSCVMPYLHVDMDASSPQSAMMTAYLNNVQALWAYERQAHKGPVLGEGGNHWFYSGLLDGAEARVVGGSSAAAQNLGEMLPLFVDFDLLKIHPLQVNYGMGLYNSWTQTGTVSLTTEDADAYRTQEIAFGHAPFVSQRIWNEVPLA